jgi:exodeoxyribonuclease VII small subunit|tara:strand:- start:154 stop:393 length:240 start_codon:yes stop_codon:yes gene_type:complete
MNLLDKKIENLEFEEAFERLNKIIDLIDEGDISLDDSIKYYEVGILLKNHCERKLKDAELKIKKVVDNKVEDADEKDFK